MSNDPLAIAGHLAEEMRRASDLLTGAVTVLVSEGWTEEQARQIVVAIFVASSRQTKP